MTLDIDAVRPPVLGRETARALDPYLAFRHRFRNIYVFDLEREPMRVLLVGGKDAWKAFDADVRAFIERLRAWIPALQQP
jgi:hypothetical protein